jgi:Fe-S cluster assembly protein SufD
MKQILLTKPGQYTYTLSREGEEIEILGAFEVTDHQTEQVTVFVSHKAPHTRCRMDLRATVATDAMITISGNIHINKDAVDTQSFLTEKILLLSSTSRGEAIPNLEIDQNDVQCSHAATIGPIDAQQLFYLTTRGIPQDPAITQIAKGFLLEVTDKMKQ